MGLSRWSSFVATNIKTGPLETLPGNQFYSVWFPGDSLLGFLTETAFGYEVFTVRPDGSDLRQRTSFQQYVPPSFDFTPEGNLILEVRVVVGGRSNLYEASLVGDTLHRLTSDADGDESRPAVSPDGSRLAYSKGGQVWISERSGANASRALPDFTSLSGDASIYVPWTAGAGAPS